jgi:SulP family sulfate permease
LVAITRWDLQGLAVVGHIPEGLPELTKTKIPTELFGQLLPLAFALAVLGYMEIISIGKGIEEKEEQFNIKPNQELLALGTSNFLGAFFQSYPL